MVATELEDVPGTAETLTSANANVRVMDFDMGLNVSMDADPAKYLTGDFHLGESVPGTTSANISFVTKWHNDATEPSWTKFLRSCGCSGVAGSGPWGTGWIFYPTKYQAEQTLTIGVYDVERGSVPSGMFYSFAGAIGNATISTEGAGKPISCKYEYTGSLNDITDITEASIPALSGVSTTSYDRFLNGSGTIGANEVCISTFELNFNNTVSPVECIGSETGISKFAITAAEPTLTINPLLQRQSDYDFWSNWLNGTIQEVTITTDQFKLVVPRAQITNSQIADGDGILRNTLTFRCLRNNTVGTYDESPFQLYVIN
jgi:hypothetical protein